MPREHQYHALTVADVVDETSLTNAIERFAERNIVLPTFAQLADPTTIPAASASKVRKPREPNLHRACMRPS